MWIFHAHGKGQPYFCSTRTEARRLKAQLAKGGYRTTTPRHVWPRGKEWQPEKPLKGAPRFDCKGD